MRKEYDFSKSQKNPDARRLKHQVTIRMDEGTVIKRTKNSLRESASLTGLQDAGNTILNY